MNEEHRYKTNSLVRAQFAEYNVWFAIDINNIISKCFAFNVFEWKNLESYELL